MIVRPFTFLTALLFALSGAYLFVVKHQSASLEAQLEQSAGATRQDEEAIRVLKAQWALEADPSRIAALASQFTGLQPMKPVQLVTLASLANDLPEPGSSAPYGNPEDGVPGLSGPGAAPASLGPPIEVNVHVAAQQARVQGFSEPSQQTVYPTQVAENIAPVEANLPKPPPVRPHISEQRIAAHLAAEVKPRAKVINRAHVTQPQSAIYEASASSVIPQPPMPHLERRLPLGAQVMRVRATAEPERETPPVVPLGGGSLLGMAQTGSQN
ncbi:MAG: hypothetical protein KGJ73_10105 [Rhodospirillales bacterium]|nr:hypothetical protein [Rhodospirillales bacterium]